MSAIPVLTGWEVGQGSLNGEHAHYAVPVVSQGEAAVLGCGHGQWHIIRAMAGVGKLGRAGGGGVLGGGRGHGYSQCVYSSHTSFSWFVSHATTVHIPGPLLRGLCSEHQLWYIVGQELVRVREAGSGMHSHLGVWIRYRKAGQMRQKM